MRWMTFFLFLLPFVGMTTFGAEERHFDFTEGDHGFIGDFADLPKDHDNFKLFAGRRQLPEELGDGKSLFISGSNHSDDLFMYFKAPIEDLEPDTVYRVVFELTFASNVPEGIPGIGGSPSDSVFLKAGAAPVEPQASPDKMDWLRLNVDKGNQSSIGARATLLGTIGKPDDGTDEFVRLVHDNQKHPLGVKTDENGQAWVFFGTDSGFEGTTALYYLDLDVQFRKATLPQNDPPKPLLRVETGRAVVMWGSGMLETSKDLLKWRKVGSAKDAAPHVQVIEPKKDRQRRFWRVIDGADTVP